MWSETLQSGNVAVAQRIPMRLHRRPLLADGQSAAPATSNRSIPYVPTTLEELVNGDTLAFAQVMTVIVMSTASFVAIALGSRILWLKGSRVKPQRDVSYDEDRQQRLETAVDAIAIEVERISEAQRFMVGLMSQSLPAARVERKEVGSADRAAGRIITPH